MIHEMKLKEVYFDKIKNKQKIYEIRLNDEKRQLIKIGDFIFFKKCETRILDLTAFLKSKFKRFIMIFIQEKKN